MGRQGNNPDKASAEKPDTASNSGYAETKPRNKKQAQTPGAKQPPDTEEGGLEHEPDPST